MSNLSLLNKAKGYAGKGKELGSQLLNGARSYADDAESFLKKPKTRDTIENIKNTFNGKNIRDAHYNKELTTNMKNFNAPASELKKLHSLADRNTFKQYAKTSGAYGSTLGGTGYGAKKVLDKKKKKQEAKQIEQQACELYEYALRKVAACEEMYEDGVFDQESCIEVLAEAGLYDEHGFNKEASESSEEAYEFTEGVSSIYDESLQKIAAAEECYEEAIEELGTAMEVLAHFGYEF